MRIFFHLYSFFEPVVFENLRFLPFIAIFELKDSAVFVVSLTMAIVGLKGVFAEWDNTPEIRERVRCQHSLFVKAPLDSKPRASVDCAEANFAVLKPLAKRLKDHSGNVGMISIPAIQIQSLRLYLFVQSVLFQL